MREKERERERKREKEKKTERLKRVSFKRRNSGFEPGIACMHHVECDRCCSAIGSASSARCLH